MPHQVGGVVWGLHVRKERACACLQGAAAEPAGGAALQGAAAVPAPRAIACHRWAASALQSRFSTVAAGLDCSSMPFSFPSRRCITRSFFTFPSSTTCKAAAAGPSSAPPNPSLSSAPHGHCHMASTVCRPPAGAVRPPASCSLAHRIAQSAAFFLI
jgi:hypothetical protein